MIHILEMLMPNGFNTAVVLTWITAVVSTLPFAAGMTGYLLGHLNLWQRVALLTSTILLIFPGVFTDGGGLLLLFGVGAQQYLKGKRDVLRNSLPNKVS